MKKKKKTLSIQCHTMRIATRVTELGTQTAIVECNNNNSYSTIPVLKFEPVWVYIICWRNPTGFDAPPPDRPCLMKSNWFN